MGLSAWKKGDLVRYKEKEFRLTSEAYEIEPGRMGFDTDRKSEKKISYLKLMEKGHLLEDANGRKNLPVT